MRTELVLASASPRRLELLRSIGLNPRVDAADIDESQRPGERAVEYAARLAEEKAAVVVPRAPGAAVLAADTVVVLDDADGREVLLGKPADAAEARRMLTSLSGRTHRVVTAFHLIGPERSLTRVVDTEVEMRPLGDAEVEEYVSGGEWQGKAGGYAVQGLASAFVRAIRGSYTGIVGLPVSEVIEALRTLGLVADSWAPRLPGSGR